MRAAYQLVLHRESSELERALIDQRLDEAFERVYEYLEPAARYLRQSCDADGCRALDQLERAYQQALEHAARSGIGCQPVRKSDAIPHGQRTIAPAPPPPVPAGASHVGLGEADTVIFVRPCG